MKGHVCQYCGKPLPPERKALKNCDECRKEKAREYNTNYRRRINSEHKKEDRKNLSFISERKKPEMSLAEVNQAARQQGVSYGVFVSQRNSKKSGVIH